MASHRAVEDACLAEVMFCICLVWIGQQALLGFPPLLAWVGALLSPLPAYLIPADRTPGRACACVQDGVVDEFDVGAAADLRPPGSHMLLPLRLLDNFTLYTLEEDEDGDSGAEGTRAETLVGLEQLVDGATPTI